jgi:tetratricopeptide (TPR) repeat protein
VSTRRRFQDSQAGGSRLRTRRISQITGGASEERQEDGADEESVWAVDVGDGQLQLVRGSGALKELIRSRGLPKTAPVYMLSTIAARLGDVDEAREAFGGTSDVDPVKVEPELEAPRAEAPALALEAAVEMVAAERPAPAVEVERPAPAVEVEQPAPVVEAAPAADDDFSLLDRPLDDGEYYEDPPSARWLRPVGTVALVVALGFAGFQMFRPRNVARVSTPKPETPSVAVAAPPPATVAPPAPVPVAAPVAAAAPVVAAAPVAVAPAPAPQPAVAGAPVAAPAPAPDPTADSIEAAPPLSPKYPSLVAEGERQFQAGRTKRAQTLFEQALAETPEGTAALVGLGYVHLDRGKVPQAIALFQKALVQDRDNATALFGLAESHRQAGDRSAALAEFQRFLTLRSTGSDSDIARQLVSQLSSGG